MRCPKSRIKLMKLTSVLLHSSGAAAATDFAAAPGSYKPLLQLQFHVEPLSAPIRLFADHVVMENVAVALWCGHQTSRHFDRTDSSCFY